jgi:hypothetical protein
VDFARLLYAIQDENQQGFRQLADEANANKRQRVFIPNQHQLSALAKLKSLENSLAAGEFSAMPPTLTYPIRQAGLEFRARSETMLAMMTTGREDPAALDTYVRAATAAKAFEEGIDEFSRDCTRVCPDFPSQYRR